MNQSVEATFAVDEILRFNADRKQDLVRIKYQRMAENVFAFFRGTDHLFASRWPLFRPAELGPGILICGDLHLENFGAYQTDDRDYRYDINDFDEALVAPCSVDLVRCAASTLLAADIWSIPAAQASGIALDFLTSYRDAVVEAVRSGQLPEVAPQQGAGPIWDLLGETAINDHVALLDHHTEIHHHGQRRILRDPGKHPEVGEKRMAQVCQAIENYGNSTDAPGIYRVLDVTGRIVGIGSLGVHRYIVLVAGGGTTDTNRLLDVKEATPCSVLGCSSFAQPDTGGNDALRVVRAQRQLQSKPTAGLAAIDIEERHFRLREMVPDENRSKLDRLQKQPVKLRSAVRVAGQLTGSSHVRGCGTDGTDDRQKLASWAGGGALDSVLSAAVRCVDRTYQDFESFSAAHAAGRFEKH